MILTGTEIKRNVQLNRIIIEPFNPKQINPNSYNYRLGDSYIEISVDEKYDLSIQQDCGVKKRISESGTIFKKDHLYLCNTYEKIGSDYYVTSLIGKSSMGRLGMFLQVSADLGHQGEIHKWTLEIRPCVSIIVYPRMIIGQVSFWKVEGEKLDSIGYYKGFDSPTLSKGV